jgi:hypothetical protein
MPIRINLLSEALAEEDLRRRDPVKQAIYLGLFLFVLSLVWFSSAWLKSKMTQTNLSQIEEQIKTHQSENERVQADFKRIGESKRRLTALSQLNTNRFLQGNLLNAMQQVYVPNVQLVRLKIEQSYELKAGTPAKTNDFGTVAGRPATSVEHITLTLDARDAGSNPGDQVNKYKNAIATSAYFKSSLDQTNGIKLSNLSPAQTSFSGKPFVLFTLNCRFLDISR